MNYEGLNDEVVKRIDDFKRYHSNRGFNIGVTSKHISDMICDFSALNFAYTTVECDYESIKNQYEVELIRLKYSDDYQQYKTVKEKEERAKVELEGQKDKLIKMKYQLHMLKGKIEELEKSLRLAFMIYGRED